MNREFKVFHLDTLRVPKLVPHQALQLGADIVDPSRKIKTFPGPGSQNPAFREQILKASGPRPRRKL